MVMMVIAFCAVVTLSAALLGVAGEVRAARPDRARRDRRRAARQETRAAVRAGWAASREAAARARLPRATKRRESEVRMWEAVQVVLGRRNARLLKVTLELRELTVELRALIVLLARQDVGPGQEGVVLSVGGWAAGSGPTAATPSGTNGSERASCPPNSYRRARGILSRRPPLCSHPRQAEPYCVSARTHSQPSSSSANRGGRACRCMTLRARGSASIPGWYSGTSA
jgi:hypothetical protein